jgi:H+/gluconate symporter-like permease
MFCKHCGKQIDNDSKFCIYCGSPLTNSNTQVKNEQIVSPQTVKKLETVFGINLSKPIIGGYLVWVLIHLILLLTNWKASDSANEYFWPFSKRAELEDYDFTEFLLYTVVPLIILVIINLFKEPKEKKQVALEQKYDLSYEGDTTPTIVGVFILIISMLFYFIGGTGEREDHEKAMQTRAIASIVSLFLRIVITIWTVSIAKKLNRDTVGWGFLAFFFPSIALIIIGQKRKLRQ